MITRSWWGGNAAAGLAVVVTSLLVGCGQAPPPGPGDGRAPPGAGVPPGPGGEAGNPGGPGGPGGQGGPGGPGQPGGPGGPGGPGMEGPGSAGPGDHAVPGGPGVPAAPQPGGVPPPTAEATPATFDGHGLTGLLVAPKQPWAYAIDAGNGRWWDRSSGATEPGPGPGDAAAMAPDGHLLVVQGGKLSEWTRGEKAAKALGAVGANVHAMTVSPDGEWLLVQGDDVVVLPRAGGAAVWTLPSAGVAAAGFWGDRVVYAKGGDVHQVKVRAGQASASRDDVLGALPMADGATWTVAPDGSWAARKDDALTIWPVTAIGAAQPPKPLALVLTPGTTGFAWLDADRIVTFAPDGLRLYHDGQPVPLQGDVVKDPNADALGKLKQVEK